MVMYNAKGCLFPGTIVNTPFYHYFIFFALLTISISCRDGIPEDYFFIPGEFEEQEAVWLGCQLNDFAYKQVRSDLVKEILPYIPIKIIAPSDDALRQCKLMLEEDHINTGLISFHVMPDNEFWLRDHGATFTVNKKGEMKVIDFEWTDYGYESWLRSYFKGDATKVKYEMANFPKTNKGKVDSLMGALLDVPIEKSWVRIEGGMLETNGKGTMILNEPLTLSRNYGASKDSIAQEFNRVLGISNIIWLQDGLVEDPHICGTLTGHYVAIGTGGHVDQYVRFANHNTILLAWVPEEEKDLNAINQINYKRMNLNYQILSNSKDLNGKKFNIIKVPQPDIIAIPIRINKPNEWDVNLNIPESMFLPQDGWTHGDSVIRVASTSYLNYFITNNILLLPRYSSVGSSHKKEQNVKSIFTTVFPDRKIVFVNALPLNWRGGGMHCMGKPQPKRQLLP